MKRLALVFLILLVVPMAKASVSTITAEATTNSATSGTNIVITSQITADSSGASGSVYLSCSPATYTVAEGSQSISLSQSQSTTKTFTLSASETGTYSCQVTDGTVSSTPAVTLQIESPSVLTVSGSPSSVTKTQYQTFTLSISVSNPTSSSITTSYTLSYSGLTMDAGDQTSNTVTISAGSSTNLEWTVNATSSGSKSITLQLGDNSNAFSSSVTVSAASTTSTATTTASSSSTGGSATQQVTNVTSSYRFLTLPAGVNAATFARTEIAVREIEVKVKSQVENILFEVTKYGTRPADVSASSGTVYQYMKITKGALTDDNMEYAKIKFRVEKSWLSVNSISADSIALYRYADNAWNKIGVTRTAEDSTYYFYEAGVTGFSYFVIAAEAPAQTTTTETATTIAGGNQTSTTVESLNQTTTSEGGGVKLPSVPGKINVKMIGAVLGVLIIGLATFFLLKNYQTREEKVKTKYDYNALKKKWS